MTNNKMARVIARLDRAIQEAGNEIDAMRGSSTTFFNGDQRDNMTENVHSRTLGE